MEIATLSEPLPLGWPRGAIWKPSVIDDAKDLVDVQHGWFIQVGGYGFIRAIITSIKPIRVVKGKQKCHFTNVLSSVQLLYTKILNVTDHHELGTSADIFLRNFIVIQIGKYLPMDDRQYYELTKPS